jgi:hypothetical protein
LEVSRLGATTVAAPAAAPILSTVLLLIVPSVFFPTLCRSFAFFLGIESPFSRSVGLNPKNPLLVVMTLPLNRGDQALDPWSNFPAKAISLKGEGFAETVE